MSKGWTQITGIKGLNMYNVTKIRVEYLRYGGPLSIGVGLLTKQRKNADYSGDVDHLESVCYWSRAGYHKGCICSNGIKITDWNSLLFND